MTSQMFEDEGGKDTICPECGSDDRKEHEVPGHYDGPLYYSCGVCNLAWSRDWRGYGKFRTDQAATRVRQHNQARAKALYDPEQP